MGAIVDDGVIDQALGGINLVHLIRNLLVTCAVWFVREGVFRAFAGSCRSRAKVSRHPAVLILALFTITVTFGLQDFMPTTNTYIPQAAHQPAVFIYATVYMAFLAYLALSVVRVCAEPQESRPVRVSARVMAAGMLLIAAASVDEILYMALRFTGMQGALVEITYALFKTPFFLGIVLVSLGLAVPPVVRLWRRLSVRDRVAVLYMAMNTADSTAGTTMVAGVRESLSPEPAARLYESVVRELDRRIQHPDRVPSAGAEAALRFAQGSFKEDAHLAVARKVRH